MPRSMSTTPTTPRDCWPTSRSSCSTARATRSSGGRRSASCWGSCRGTSPTTRWRDSRGPNLCIGNTILLKHAPQCPESAAAIQQIYDDAGFPEGAYVNVYATNDQAATIIADPRVQGVSLTGSERAGAAVAEIAGRNLKKVVLELGGSDPFIVLSTDDLDAVVERGVAARMDNTGQSCNAAKRFIVADDLYDEFVKKFTAAALAHGEGIAPAVVGRRRRAASGAGRPCGRTRRVARQLWRTPRRGVPVRSAHRSHP